MQKSPINFILLNALLELGFRIVVIDFNGELQYWSVTEFTPSTLGSEPVDFCDLSGVNITEFMKTHATGATKELSVLYDKFIEKNPIIKYKFQKSLPWLWFTK